MKILFTTSFYPPYYIGGACVHVKNLAEALVKEGHEVHVMFSMDAYNLKRGKEKKIENWNGVKVHILRSPLRKLEPILNFWFGTQKYTYTYFKNLIKKEKFDVVHHHNISLLGYNILKKIGDYKNIYTAHDYWLICHKYDFSRNGNVCYNRANCIMCSTLHKKPYQLFRKTKKFKDTIKDIDVIITPSKFVAGILSERLNNQVVNIPNFILKFDERGLKKEKREYFLFVGQLEKHKGILELIDIFKRVNKKLIIVGTGSLDSEVKNRIKDNKNITFVGWKSKDELAQFYSNALALIVPSKWAENFPTVALESFYFGTPVITSNLGGTSEIVGLLDKKLIFDSHDFNQLKKLITNFKSEKYSPKIIKKIFLKNFNEKSFLKRYKDVIKINCDDSLNIIHEFGRLK